MSVLIHIAEPDLNGGYVLKLDILFHSITFC